MVIALMTAVALGTAVLVGVALGVVHDRGRTVAASPDPAVLVLMMWLVRLAEAQGGAPQVFKASVDGFRRTGQ